MQFLSKRFRKTLSKQNCSRDIKKRRGVFSISRTAREELHVIPDSVTDEQAVFVEPLAAAFEIVEQIHVEPNWKIAVVGDGRLGQLVCKVLRLYYQDITCFGRHDRKISMLQKLQIKTKLKIDSEDEYNHDLVVEATGHQSGFLDTLKLVKPRGIIVLKSTIASHDKLDLTPAVVNEVTVVGSRCGPFKPAINALTTGKVSVDELIDAIYPLEKFKDAFEYASKPGVLKVLLKP
jgi:threonine dehydrogenase-like Zn-dependent dehydrogenase